MTDGQRSRVDVLVREEERRRIGRDLHDGLGAALAAQTLALDAVADRIASDPAGARELVVAVKRDIQAVVADVRRLVHELRQPALEELGLGDALAAEASRLAPTSAVAIRLRSDPDPLPDLPVGVEVAALRIAQEAITNVLRHSRATRCTITLALAGGALVLRVLDDGAGLPVVLRPGTGLTSMHERAAELGGGCRVVDGLTGGVEVVASLPLGDRPSGGDQGVERVLVPGVGDAQRRAGPAGR